MLAILDHDALVVKTFFVSGFAASSDHDSGQVDAAAGHDVMVTGGDPREYGTTP